jgi:hypothetical protein
MPAFGTGYHPTGNPKEEVAVLFEPSHDYYIVRKRADGTVKKIVRKCTVKERKTAGKMFRETKPSDETDETDSENG